MADLPLWTSLETNQILDWFALTVCLQDEININLELIWVHEQINHVETIEKIVKDLNHWTTKISRVDKVHEDEFEKELEDSIHKRKSEAKTKRKKETQMKDVESC